MYYIYVGRLDELKGIKILFKAWKQMRDSAPRLKICGSGPLENWCKIFIKENRLEMIEMLGFVSNEKILKLMADSRALILPTQCYEGFPMIILEAFSVGIPVICSDIGNTSSIVEESVTGLHFKHGIVKSLIETVNRIDKYSWDSVLSIYKHLYTEKANYENLINIYNIIQNRT